MRTITVEIQVSQPEANWIWDAHGANKTMHGCKIIGISEGSLQSQLDEAEAEIRERDLEDEWQDE